MSADTTARYPTTRSPTGALRYFLVSVVAATLVGWIFGGAALSFYGPSSIAPGQFWVDMLNWGVMIVPFTLILSAILVLLALAIGVGCARLTPSLGVRFAVIATALTLVTAPIVWFFGTAVADQPNLIAVTGIALVIGLSLATGAVAPWKGGFASPARVASSLAHD